MFSHILDEVEVSGPAILKKYKDIIPNTEITTEDANRLMEMDWGELFTTIDPDDFEFEDIIRSNKALYELTTLLVEPVLGCEMTPIEYYSTFEIYNGRIIMKK